MGIQDISSNFQTILFYENSEEEVEKSGQLSVVVLTRSRTHPQGGVGIVVLVVWVTGRCHQHLLGRDWVDFEKHRFCQILESWLVS